MSVLSAILWVGEWENMNRLVRSGRKVELGPKVLAEAEAIMQRLPEKERTNFAAMYCLDAAAKVVLDAERRDHEA